MSMKKFCKNVISVLSGTQQTGTENTLTRLRASTALVPMGGESISQKFTRDERGNVAMIFGIGSLVLFLSAGLAVDVSRYNLVHGDLIESLDAAGLAIAQYQASNEDISDADLKLIGRKFFDENFRYPDLIDEMNVDFLISNTKIEPKVTGTMDALILQTFEVGKVRFDFTNFDLASSTEITKKGSGRIELALVLDVTGSMGNPANGNSGPSKLDDLKDSVDIMLGTLYGDATVDENIKISVVPFNAHVNIGTSDKIQSSDWLDLDGEAIYHGARFIHAVYPTENDTSLDARKQNSDGNANGNDGYNSSTGIPKLIDVNTKVNHFDLYASSSSLEWKGCIEARPYPLDELDVPSNGTISAADIDALVASVPESVDDTKAAGERTETAFESMSDLTIPSDVLARSENLLFVPIFAPDGPNCESNGDPCLNLNSSGFITNSEYGYNHKVYWRDYNYDDPDDAGHSENHYDNNDFVREWSFAKPTAGGGRGAVYADFVRSFRHALDDGRNDGGYWQAIRERFEELGADNFGQKEYIARTTYVGLFDPASKTYDYHYDDNVSYSLTNNRHPNPYCPDPIVPLTSNRTTVRDAVQALSANGTTNSAFGTMWGWRTLSPEPPFEEGVEYDDGQWQKVIVVMTDGQNVVWGRDTHWDSDLNAYGYASEERMGDGIDQAWKMRNEIDEKMLRICQRMKDEGILVYSVMFGLDTTDEESNSYEVNKEVEELYQACASEPQPPYFHNVLTGADLESAFGDIAADLVDLHVSK